jgi:hypothetical protein
VGQEQEEDDHGCGTVDGHHAALLWQEALGQLEVRGREGALERERGKLSIQNGIDPNPETEQKYKCNMQQFQKRVTVHLRKCDWGIQIGI